MNTEQKRDAFKQFYREIKVDSPIWNSIRPTLVAVYELNTQSHMRGGMFEVIDSCPPVDVDKLYLAMLKARLVA